MFSFIHYTWRTSQQIIIWCVLERSIIIIRLLSKTKQILIYLHTPGSGVLLQKLTDFQLVKKFPTFYGTQRFVTTFTSVRHLSIYSARTIQSITPQPNSRRSILILSSHLSLGLPNILFPSSFPTKTLYTHLHSLIRATCPLPPISLSMILSPEQYWVQSTDH